MWDEQDGFYYDLLRLPDGSATRLKVRSMVGLLPLCATTVIEKWQRERVPRATSWTPGSPAARCPSCRNAIHPTGPGHLGVAERGILALVNPERLRRILSKMLDESEFLSPYGIRSLSKFHAAASHTSSHVHGQPTTGRASARVTRPAGRGPSPCSSTSLAFSTPSGSWKWGRRRSLPPVPGARAEGVYEAGGGQESPGQRGPSPSGSSGRSSWEGASAPST